MIHKALKASLETAPTKVRLDHFEHAQFTVQEIVNRINNIGTVKEEAFIKDEYRVIKLDMELFGIRQQWEEEERERIEREKAEAEAKLTRQTSQELFNSKLFEPHTLSALTTKVETQMTGALKRMVSA